MLMLANARVRSACRTPSTVGHLVGSPVPEIAPDAAGQLTSGGMHVRPGDHVSDRRTEMMKPGIGDGSQDRLALRVEVQGHGGTTARAARLARHGLTA